MLLAGGWPRPIRYVWPRVRSSFERDIDLDDGSAIVRQVSSFVRRPWIVHQGICLLGYPCQPKAVA